MKYILSLIVALFFLNSLTGQVPENDLIENATLLNEFPYKDEQINMNDASDGGDLCLLYSNKIFYKYQPTEDKVLAVALPYEPSGNYEIAFFISSVPNATSHSQLSNLPGYQCSDSGSRYAQFMLESGNTYYVVVGTDVGATIDSPLDIHFNISDEENVQFPDENLASQMTSYNSYGSNDIEIAEAMLVTSPVNIEGPPQEQFKIEDLTGLENFFNMSGLSISNNKLSEVDLSHFPKLEYFWADNNNLSELDFSSNTLLTDIRFSYNSLSSIDLSQNTLLDRLEFSNNEFSEIQIPVTVKRLDMRSNLFSEIDVSYLVNLEVLWVSGNLVSELDVTNNPFLRQIVFSGPNLNQIDLTQNLLLQDLEANNIGLDILDLTSNTMLEYINISETNLSSLDLSQNTLLEEVRISGCNFSSLDLSLNTILTKLNISSTPLVNLDLSANQLLFDLFLVDTNLSTLDLSSNINLSVVNVTNNYFLKNINLKNGTNNLISYYATNHNPNLEIVCVDDVSYAELIFVDPSLVGFIFTDNCGILTSRNVIEGIATLDIGSDGCDPQDPKLVSQRVTSTSANFNSIVYTNNNGFYKCLVSDGSYSTAVNLPNYFDYAPNDSLIEFTDFNNTEVLDFCVEDNTAVNDLNIVIIPTSEARPGFDATYRIVYENIGSTTLSGSISLEFNESQQTFLNASPIEDSINANELTFDFVDILPFETREINFQMNTFPPPTINGDDIINLMASIEIAEIDVTPEDNQFTLNQIVVNSFDPNDKLVLQGAEITLDQIDDYLHYVVRFQNTGTASAINVVILDELFYMLDVSTFQPITASHEYTARIISGNTVEFSFENINLPAEQDDATGSNGFVSFKIKPFAPIISVGSVITGEADIYFDFNAPIRTNEVATEVVDTLSEVENQMTENIIIYPNPTSGKIEFQLLDGSIVEQISVFDIRGSLLVSSNSLDSLDLTNYSNGVYFLKVKTNKGILKTKIIKN